LIQAPQASVMTLNKSSLIEFIAASSMQII